MEREFEGKVLLILGGNPETTPLVEVANSMGVKTIVTSGRHTDAAKKAAWKSYDVDGMNVDGIVELAKSEKVDGVLVGVADILVPSYCKVCEILKLPCYATQKIVDVFSYKDVFKATCEKYGVHGIPEYKLDAGLKREDLDKIEYPVMVKPVDNGGGVGMTVAYNEAELVEGVKKALEASNKKRFIVEKYMQCDDVGIYYTFKDGVCSASCIYDRYTTDKQRGMSRVNMCSVYPSAHIDDYYKNMHLNALQMFKEIDIQNGVLLLSGFYDNGEFYMYDPGFRLQGEAPHILIKAINGYDQRESLVRFALTGSQGEYSLEEIDDIKFKNKYAATLWILLNEGKIKEINGLTEIENDKRVVANVQRLYVGDEVYNEWIGTEKQVLTRIYIVCDSKEELLSCIDEFQEKIKVLSENALSLVLGGVDTNKIK